jgi:hypothetical protein
MKAKHITLQVPEPCHENWDNMTPNDKGRFCNACSKTVVDFTRHSESELDQYFKDLKSPVCGRYTGEQLNKPMLMPPEPRFHPVYKWVAGLFFFITGWAVKSKAQSQNTAGIPQTSQNIVKGKIRAETGLQGFVTDERGSALAGVSVSCKNSGDTVLTDMYGKYELPFFAFQNTDKVILEFQRLNYTRAEYQSQFSDLPSIIKMDLTAIPYDQRRPEIRIDELTGDTIKVVALEQIEITLREPVIVHHYGGISIMRIEEKEIKAEHPPIDLNSNTTIIR